MKVIYVDGGGGADSGYGYIVDGTGESKYIKEPGLTNNQAEYKAILRAVTDFEDEEDGILIKSDSRNTVKQLQHEFAINKDSLRDLARQVWTTIGNMTCNVEFEWVPRKENKAGKMLGS
jgi:ribonuclease HI